MKTTYSITCGIVPFSPTSEEDLMSFTLATQEEVRETAEAFIQVFPEELDEYQKAIKEWDGKARLILSHQDDDYFIFIINPNTVTGVPGEFHSFVSANAVDDRDDDEDTDEDE